MNPRMSSLKKERAKRSIAMYGVAPVPGLLGIDVHTAGKGMFPQERPNPQVRRRERSRFLPQRRCTNVIL
jgi:hypothetical protein